MVPLIMGTIQRTERYHIPAVNYLIDVADDILMVEIMDFLVGHTAAVPLTA